MFYDFILFEFFTSVLTGGLSLKSERQQGSSVLQNSSQYSSCSQQCCGLDIPDSSFDLKFPESLFSDLWGPLQ